MENSAFLELLTDARVHAANHNYKKAFSIFVQAFNMCSRMKKRLEPEFREVLNKLNDDLYQSDDLPEVFQNFELAIRHFPGNAHLLNDIGKYLYKYGLLGEALCHFEKALKVDSCFVSIERNLNDAKRKLFPRHYFRNLNDKRKNEAFRRALKQATAAAVDSILDLNAGTGLLTLYATECRTVSIIACDPSKTMVRLTECILEANNAYGIVVVNKPCGKLHYRDVYGTRTLVVTDMFDAGLFGAGILQNISKAWECILSDEARVLPGRAEYFIMGVRSDKLRDKYQLNDYAKKLLGVTSKNVHTTLPFNYCGEDVSNYEDVEYVTEPVSMLTIDFNNYDDIQDKLLKKDPYSVDLKAIDTSKMTAVVGWFNVHLTDDVMITNDPRLDDRIDAWQPAVFYDTITKDVKEGDVISVQMASYGGRLRLVTEPGIITRVSQEMIKFLNDTEYMRALVESLPMNCVYLGQSVDITEVDIMDLSVFPLYGFELLKRGARSLICHAKNVTDKMFIETVFEINKIPEHKYTVMLENIWNHDAFKDNKFHVVFCNVLDENGDVDVRKRQIVYHLCHAHLNEGGLLLPTQIIMYAQLISSKNLERLNRVNDENVGGFKLAKHVNRYQVSQTNNIDISQLEYTALSEPIIASNVPTHMKGEVTNVTIVRDGVCTGILCWYGIYVKEDMRARCTKDPGSFIDCLAFLATSPIPMFKGDVANIIRCIDPDGTLKLVVDCDV